MTIRHLIVFIKVCELGSISKTAEALHIAQPSVSQAIKDIENYYDVILFDRVNRKIVITREGELLLQEAKDVIREFDQFEILARKENLNPVVKIGATMTFGAFIIPKFAKLIHELIPDADPKFFVDKPSALEEKIHKGDLDFALQEGVINSKLLKAVQIGSDELIAICSPTYNAPEKLNITNLVDYPLLLRERGNPSRRILDYLLQMKGIPVPSPLVESVSNNCILSMAMEGEGIGILPSAIARRYLANGSIRRIELDIPLRRKLFLVSHKEKIFNSTCKKAYDIALKILEKK